MTNISRSALVPFGADQMFFLVNDIPSYPQFLPWCKSAQILSAHEDEMNANIEMAKAGLHKSFTTANRLQKNKMIEMRLIEGPFKHLEGFWRFEKLSHSACKISLDIEFEFTNTVLRMTLGPAFGQICNTLVEAFVKRAQEIYAK